MKTGITKIKMQTLKGWKSQYLILFEMANKNSSMHKLWKICRVRIYKIINDREGRTQGIGEIKRSVVE